MTVRWRDDLTRLLIIVLAICALRNWFFSYGEMHRFYTNIPIWDAYEWLAHYARYKAHDWSVLWIQHNEHREVGTELLFAWDMLHFHGRQLLPTYVGVAAYVGSLLIFVALLFYPVENSREKQFAVCCALLIAILGGYKMCVISLTIPFLTSWPQWEFFGAAALAALTLKTTTGNSIPLVFSMLFAVAATYSMSNGMLVWPLLLIAGCVLPYTARERSAIAICGVLSIAAYFYHYKDMHSLAVATALTHPVYLFGFIGSFLGMPFSAAQGMSNPWRAAAYGWLALSIAAVNLGFIIRRRVASKPPVLALGGFCLLVLASTLLTAMGRMNPQDPFFQAARAGRYLTEPMLFWCALIALSGWLLRDVGTKSLGLVFVLGMSVMFALVLPRTKGYYSWWENYFAQGQWASVAVANGAMDHSISDVLFPSGGFVLEFGHVLTDNHLAVFSAREAGWFGKPIGELFKKRLGFVFNGSVTTVKPLASGYEIQGWCDGVSEVVFTDPQGRVIGFGKHLPAGAPVLYSKSVPASLVFSGFIRPDSGAHAFSVWAVEGRRASLISQTAQPQIPLP